MGIQSFYNPAATESYVIFAANRHLSNEVRAWLSLNTEWFKPLIGCYKGKMENSFMVKKSDFPKVKCLLEGEESILELGTMDSCGRRKAKLIFLDGISAEIDLGRMVETSKEKALAQDAWTLDCQHNTYFICQHFDKFGQAIAA